MKMNLPALFYKRDAVKLRVENIWLSFGGVAALSGISFDVREGEMLAIIGSEKGGELLELVQALPPYRVRSLSPAARWGDIGQMKHAIEVKGLDKVCSELAGKGVRFMCSPGPIPKMDARHCYIQDPDDAIIELIEFLS
jgi:ABC-type uncharacterized transport system ATPase subunit